MQFVLDLNNYYNVADAGTNSNIVGSVANITKVIDEGGLSTTFHAENKIYDGDFGGTLIDGDVF